MPPPLTRVLRSSDGGRTTGRQRVALVGLGLVLTLGLLEVGLRAGGCVFLLLQARRNAASLREGRRLVVLCIGESTTALGGGGAYPPQLEQALARQAGRPVASVVNEGVPGTNTDAILDRLPELLDRYHPDVVVAMMGINDLPGDAAEPTALVGWLTSLRAVKLAMLVVSRVAADWRGVTAPAPVSEAVDPASAEARLRARLEADRSDEAALADLGGLYVAQRRDADARAVLIPAVAHGPGADVARLLLAMLDGAPADGSGLAPGEAEVAHDLVRLFEPGRRSAVIVSAIGHSPTPGVILALVRHAASVGAEEQARAGHPAEAERLLQRFAVVPGKPLDDGYYGWLARLAHARGDFDGFEHYLAVAESVRPKDGYPTTARNYHALRRLVHERGLTLVAMQYPLRRVDVLRRMLDADPAVPVVDNEAVFKEALRHAPYARYFTDSFAGDFGHMTPEGNRLLADNVAAAILAWLPGVARAGQPPASGASR